MADKVNLYVEGFRDSLRTWSDERFISRQQIDDFAMFSLYLVNLLDDAGWSYYGHSYSQRGIMGCLVVKADHEDTPHVVFVNARTYPGNVRTFLRLLEEDQLEWRPDRFRG